MTDDNYTEEWPKTGTPAHDKSRPRSIHIDSDAPLSEKYPPYIPDPACMECGGEGFIYIQTTRFSSYDGEMEIDIEKDPCDCIFNHMTVVADPNCKSCNGTGEVEEVKIVSNNGVQERVTQNYSCLCLRYVPSSEPNEGDDDGR